MENLAESSIFRFKTMLLLLQQQQQQPQPQPQPQPTTTTTTRKNKNIIFELGSICIKTLDTNVWWNSLLTQNTQFTSRGVLHSGIHCVSGWTKPIQSNLPGPQVHYKETSTWKIFPTACLRVQNLWPLRSYWIHLSPPTSQQLGDMEGLAARDLSSTRSSSGGFLEAAWCLPSYKCGKTELPTSCWTLAKQTCDADWLVTTSSWDVLQEISFDRSHKFSENGTGPMKTALLVLRIGKKLLQYPYSTWRGFWSGPRLTLLFRVWSPSKPRCVCWATSWWEGISCNAGGSVAVVGGPHAVATEPRLASYSGSQRWNTIILWLWRIRPFS